jgi:hypothetical protein
VGRRKGCYGAAGSNPMSINSLKYVKVWESRNECGFDLPVTKKWRGRGRDFGWILGGYEGSLGIKIDFESRGFFEGTLILLSNFKIKSRTI